MSRMRGNSSSRLREDHRDRLDLGDGCDAPGIAGVDDVALIDEAKSDAARDRSFDRRIAELHLRIVDGADVRLYQRFLLRDE